MKLSSKASTTYFGNRQQVKQERSERAVGIDVVRYIGAIAVILLHSAPLNQVRGISAIGFAELASRFAVPFFFIASGYFLAGRHGSLGAVIQRLVIRLVPLYVFWVIFYVVFVPGDDQALHNPILLVKEMISGGPAFHLWFLRALGVGSVIVILGRRYLPWSLLYAAALIALAGALESGAYKLAFGLHGNPNRAGVLTAIPLILLGMWFAERQIQVSLSKAVMLATAGFILQAAESAFFDRENLIPFGNEELLFGTVLFAAGVFLMAMNMGQAGRLSSIFAALGRVSLGVYCLHLRACC